MFASQETEVPSNVPDALVRDFDMYGRLSCDGDYASWFSRINELGYPDIFWTPANGGHWVVTRGKMLREVLSNAELFSSRILIVPRERMLSPAPVPITL